jgi:hypothetical protein
MDKIKKKMKKIACLARTEFEFGGNLLPGALLQAVEKLPGSFLRIE